MPAEDRAKLFTAPFVLCWFANLLQGIAFSLFIHFPGFLKDLGANETVIGGMTGVTALAAVAVRPRLGTILDTRGRRGVILFGNALNVFVLMLYLTVTEIGGWIVFVRILHGLSEAMLFTAFFTVAADYVPERRLTEGLALFGVSGMLPISLGGLLGDRILAGGDYTLLFQTSLGFAVVAFLLSIPLRDARAKVRADGDENRPHGFRASLLQRELLPLWWVTTVFAVGLAAMFTFVKTFVMDTQIGSVGGFFTAYTGIALLLRLTLGWVPDRFGPKRTLFPALALLALGFFFLAAAETSNDVLVAGVLCGAGHGFTFPILSGMAVKRSRAADRGSAMAIYTGLMDLGLLVGGPALGVVIDARGHGAMFFVTGVAVLFGLASFAFWDRGRQ
jgi:predicted MFS family arabinose efflux permease